MTQNIKLTGAYVCLLINVYNMEMLVDLGYELQSI